MKRAPAPSPDRCRRKFLGLFPGGFRDEDYVELEREYKVEAHERWVEALPEPQFRALLKAREHGEVAARAVRVEQRTRHSMLFSFEKMALRDALKSASGARTFSEGGQNFPARIASHTPWAQRAADVCRSGE